MFSIKAAKSAGSTVKLAGTIISQLPQDNIVKVASAAVSYAVSQIYPNVQLSGTTTDYQTHGDDQA